MNIPDLLPIIGVIVTAGSLLAAALAATSIEAFFEGLRNHRKSSIAAMTAIAVRLIIVLPIALVAMAVAALIKGRHRLARLFRIGMPGSMGPKSEVVPGAPHGVPDYVVPIVAYRAWQLDGSHLRSLNGESWYPGQPLTARCRLTFLNRHQPPDKRCHCGIYAAKSLAQLRAIGYANFRIYGEVYLWGTVVEHQLGWRAQFAYPKSIIVPLQIIPTGTREAQSFLQALLVYGVDTFIDDGKRQILWAKGTGYDSAGLDCMRKGATGEIVATVPIAFLTEDPRRHVLLQNGVEVRHAAEIVFTDTRLSTNALDRITALIKDSGVKVVVVDLRAENIRLSNYVVGLVRFASKDIAIFVRSDRDTLLHLPSGMWANEYLKREGRDDLQAAFNRFRRRRTEALREMLEETKRMAS
ncbi:MAG TPA: hypothetical protein VEI01_04570 [Terriglobales bacterium]|nr:hypothetical protein [Terriglobales bacterium]